MPISELLTKFQCVLLFPTVEFIPFFLFSFIVWLSIQPKHKTTALVLFNTLFYGLYSITMLSYLISWTLLLWICGKQLKWRYLLIGLSVFSLIFWKAIDAKFIILNSVSTPLGVSFFTFQGLTYLFARMGLPKNKLEQHIEQPWGFWQLFAFVGFFPTVFSGPILRAKKWEDMLKNPEPLNKQNFSYAMTYLAIGSFYKLCLSSIFHDYVSLAYSNPQDENSLNLFIGMLSYSFEIYHDFAGYSLMAIGISLLFGFKLSENFKQPYLSINIRDFWQRWHISFSFWLRDFFYISLGGSRFGQLKHLRNTLIVMLVCGAWHGLSSNYLIWGAMHGLAVVGFHLIKDKIKLPIIISWLLTFTYVSLAWVFFRSPNATIGFEYILGLFNGNDYIINFNAHYFLICCLFVLCLFFQYLEKIFFSTERMFNSFIFSPIFSSVFWSLVFILILILSPSGMPPFIYFSY
jgi:alginate O-acetyltransferase complex protein AlgI